jgi:hypothetical protein
MSQILSLSDSKRNIMTPLLALTDREYQLILALRKVEVDFEVEAPTPAPSPSATTFRAVRYFRPTDANDKVIGNRGITAIFDVDRASKRFSVKYSICHGDVFSKSEGVRETSQHIYLPTFPYDSNLTLGANLRNELHEGLQSGSFIVGLRDDVRNILQQLRCSHL